VRRSLPSTSTYPAVSKPLGMISINHSGPFSEQFAGMRYFSVAICHMSGVTIVKTTSAITAEYSAELVTHINTLASAYNEDGVSVIRTDEGSDWTSKLMEKTVLKLNIRHEFALVDGHGQIGRVERVIRTLQEGANSSMITSGAPHKWYLHAVQHFAYIRNRLPILDNNVSRMELLTDVKQPILDFYPFMCHVPCDWYCSP